VFIFVSIHFVIDSIWKLLDMSSYLQMNCVACYYWSGKHLDNRIFCTKVSNWSVGGHVTNSLWFVAVSWLGDGICFLVYWLHANTNGCMWTSPTGADQPMHTLN